MKTHRCEMDPELQLVYVEMDGQFLKFDIEMFPRVVNYLGKISLGKDNKYRVRIDGKYKGLHRLIAEPVDDDETVFINDDFTDFRSANLINIRRGSAPFFHAKKKQRARWIPPIDNPKQKKG